MAKTVIKYRYRCRLCSHAFYMRKKSMFRRPPCPKCGKKKTSFCRKVEKVVREFYI